ncbi:MAG TPA: glycoside hydrolase family 3 N-terminal domain-containing protein, partial [Myxococcota bacterium]|nr:glycoside hydrolase family 3 N-terminal domain-containing protein [Myxococcota bacterium]
KSHAALGAAVALVALALLGCGGSGGGATAVRTAAQPEPEPPEPAGVAAMPLERQVGQLLVIAYAGTTPPQYALDALRGGRVAGVILFGGNAPDAATVRAAAARVQRAAGGDAIVSLDQERGDIRTLAFAPPDVGQARQPTPEAAAEAATASALALREVGVNVVLGPVADVAAGTTGSVMAGRAYPGDADAVAASVRAAVRAYERAGVLPVPKHFPGLGGATVNTDDAAAVVDRTRTQLAADLEPFRRSGAPLVMLGHAVYPALDPRRIASQSPAIATRLLRDELGFEGVAMTDSLEAQASLDTTDGDVGAAAVRSLQAGADLLLTTGPGSFPLVRDALLARARRSPAFRARVTESAARVVALRRNMSQR